MAAHLMVCRHIFFSVINILLIGFWWSHFFFIILQKKKRDVDTNYNIRSHFYPFIQIRMKAIGWISIDRCLIIMHLLGKQIFFAISTRPIITKQAKQILIVGKFLNNLYVNT